MHILHFSSHYIFLIHVKACPGEEHGVPDDSKGGSEPPFMLPDRSCLTPAQKKKVFEKVKEIKSELPLYVAVMGKSNVVQGKTFSVAAY
jgi:hypothetical protein